MLPIIQKSCMIFDIDVADREEAIRLMADCLYKNGYLLDKDQFCQENSIFWAVNQGKEEYVDFLVLIAVEEAKADIEYLKVLANLSRNLLHKSFVSYLKEKNVEDVYNLLKGITI